MGIREWVAAGTLAMACCAASASPVSYEGRLVDGPPKTGSVGGFSWFLDNGTGVDFWSFYALAGSTVRVVVDRLSGNLDPALSVYLGLTTADTSAFNSGASWGGLTFIGSFDDEDPPNLPGPFGDPAGSLAITTTGWYTVAVGGGSGSTDAGPYPYQIVGIGAVPEPATMLLLAVGAAGMLTYRRPRAKAG